MEIKKLEIEDISLITQCDKLLIDFFDDSCKYDDNYIKNKNMNSFYKDVGENDKILIAAISNEIVIGFLYGYIENKKHMKKPVANLTFIYVTEKYRNRKIATNLITEYIKLLKNRNIEILEVKAFPENHAAQKLYQKFNFKITWANYRTNI